MRPAALFPKDKKKEMTELSEEEDKSEREENSTKTDSLFIGAKNELEIKHQTDK